MHPAHHVTPAQDIQALKDSIEHWTRNKKLETFEGIYASTCPLCKLYTDHPDWNKCSGCPVARKTLYTNCKNTPWSNAAHMWAAKGIDSPEFLVACNKMIKFLTDILDTYPKQAVIEVREVEEVRES